MKTFTVVVESDNGVEHETMYIAVLAEDMYSVKDRVTEILRPDNETVLTFGNVRELTSEEILIGKIIKYRKACS